MLISKRDPSSLDEKVETKYSSSIGLEINFSRMSAASKMHSVVKDKWA